MNRRDFMKALVAVGAATAVAESIASDEASTWDTHRFALSYPLEPQRYLFSTDFDFEQIYNIKIYGAEDVSRAAEYAIKRVKSDVPLYKWALNTRGSLMEWRANPWCDNAITVLKGHEVEIVADFDGASTIRSKKLVQNDLVGVEYYFAHRRRLAPIGWQRLSTTEVKKIGV